jgi:pimeloyl-ACP methyl ester carboxylesterase
MNAMIKSQPVSISVSSGMIDGDLNIPADSRVVVVFAHGSGSSRHSPRNKYVAQILNEGGISTLLLDLLTPDEEVVDQRTSHLRFDIGLLADRLVNATDWLTGRKSPEARHVGYFGASTGAAAALVAAAKRPDTIEAIVSRGGRPDLAGPSLSAVRAPTQLIVGEYDGAVIELNRRAAADLRTDHRLEIIPRAGHLFEEPGALEQVADAARRWFEKHLLRNQAHVV